MIYEWDEDKHASNIEKHGIGFDAMHDAKWDASVLMEVQWEDGEEREAHLLPVGSSIHYVITTEREAATRVI